MRVGMNAAVSRWFWPLACILCEAAILHQAVWARSVNTLAESG